MPTTTKENYLKALYFLDEALDAINITELSRRLEVSKPTASNMVKSLQEKGWVVHQRYKPVQFTDKGRKAAALIIRKHRLTEMFLHKVMGFGWEEVHEIAEQMEHIDSDALFDRMDAMLDYPTRDPHGSPIPDREGNVVREEHKALPDFEAGQRVKLVALGQSSSELLHYLNRHNIELGSTIELLKVEPFDGSIQIKCDKADPMTISGMVAESLLVEPAI